MEYIIGLIIILLGGIFHFKKKADNTAIDAKLAKTKGKDEALAQEQFDLEAAIKEIDDNLEKVRKDKEEANKKRKNLTLVEIRDQIRKGLKK